MASKSTLDFEIATKKAIVWFRLTSYMALTSSQISFFYFFSLDTWAGRFTSWTNVTNNRLIVREWKELFRYKTKFFFANYLLFIFSFVNSIQEGILNKNYIMFNMISYIY